MADKPVITILTFLFDKKPRRWQELGYSSYDFTHVNALYRACKERIKIPHKFVCVTNKSEGIECATVPCWAPITLLGHDSCYLRLGAFETSFQKQFGTPYIGLLDLDVILYRDCTPVFEWAMQHDFAILKGSHYAKHRGGHLCSFYNGGFWVCKVGARPNFWWSVRQPDAEKRRAEFRMPSGHKILGSDQAWISIVSPDEVTIGPEQGAYQHRYFRDGETPDDAQLIFFAGKTKPWSDTVRTRWPNLYDEWARFAVA